MDIQVEALAQEDVRAALSVFYGALGVAPPSEERMAELEASFVPGWVLGVREGGAVVATSWSFATRTVVPGGRVVPAAAVSRVGVRPDHTRRGLLSAMMRTLLTEARERGEVLASLRATEGRIYGRFGYGVASRTRDVTVRTVGGLGLRDEAPRGGVVRVVDPADAVAVLTPLHERIGLLRAGGIGRPDTWWSATIGSTAKREHRLVVVHAGADGDDGFAVASIEERGDHFAGRPLRVHDLCAADLAATTGLWRFLLGVDLAGTVEATGRPLDEPVDLLLRDPRDAAFSRFDDETWLRILDVPAALAARSFATAEPVTVAVHDRLLPANAGVYRIADGAAELVGPTGPADLECDVAALAMAYLGDRRPSDLLATGWWQGDPAAARRADAAFATDVAPWCGTFF